METFDQLTLQEQIDYASWVACIGNEVLEFLHGARKAYSDGEREILQGKAYEALSRYQTASIETWRATLEQQQEEPINAEPDSGD